MLKFLVTVTCFMVVSVSFLAVWMLVLNRWKEEFYQDSTLVIFRELIHRKEVEVDDLARVVYKAFEKNDDPIIAAAPYRTLHRMKKEGLIKNRSDSFIELTEHGYAAANERLAAA